MNNPIPVPMKRYVVHAEPVGQLDTYVVLDRVARGISDPYTVPECQALAGWLNWRDNGYPERRKVPR